MADTNVSSQNTGHDMNYNMTWQYKSYGFKLLCNGKYDAYLNFQDDLSCMSLYVVVNSEKLYNPCWKKINLEVGMSTVDMHILHV